MCTSRPTDFAATLGLFVLVPSVRVRRGLRVTRVLVLEGSLPFSRVHLSSPAVAVCASLPFHEDARLEQGLGGLGGLALAKRDGPP